MTLYLEYHILNQLFSFTRGCIIIITINRPVFGNNFDCVSVFESCGYGRRYVKTVTAILHQQTKKTGSH